jgi:hypothetical protein
MYIYSFNILKLIDDSIKYSLSIGRLHNESYFKFTNNDCVSVCNCMYQQMMAECEGRLYWECNCACVIVEQVYSVYKHERSKSIPKPACPSNGKHKEVLSCTVYSVHLSYSLCMYTVQYRRTRKKGV